MVVKEVSVVTTVNDILTDEEKQIIAEYEEGMNNAWTKKGVDRYYNKIQAIIESAKKRYEESKK